ncbi:hypothetical protein [Serratia phage SP1]|nr:hypothetical protein [Serratia phage SP1]
MSAEFWSLVRIVVITFVIMLIAVTAMPDHGNNELKCQQLAQKLESEHHYVDGNCFIKGYGKIKRSNL